MCLSYHCLPSDELLQATRPADTLVLPDRGGEDKMRAELEQIANKAEGINQKSAIKASLSRFMKAHADLHIRKVKQYVRRYVYAFICLL